MKNAIIQQEILLIAPADFFSKKASAKNDSTDKQGARLKSQLEKASRDGVLDEMFYGVSKKSASGKRFFLWHNLNGNTFLHIDTSRFPVDIEKPLSIDADYFLSVVRLN